MVSYSFAAPALDSIKPRVMVAMEDSSITFGVITPLRD
jgi:hypothetical protein